MYHYQENRNATYLNSVHVYVAKANPVTHFNDNNILFLQMYWSHININFFSSRHLDFAVWILNKIEYVIVYRKNTKSCFKSSLGRRPKLEKKFETGRIYVFLSYYYFLIFLISQFWYVQLWFLRIPRIKKTSHASSGRRHAYLWQCQLPVRA